MVSEKVTTNQRGERAKHRNHTVPKALLKRWRTKEDAQIGHWVLDCVSGQIAFKIGTEASFAISEFRYVPVRMHAGKPAYRDEIVEDWFSKGENHLASITDRLLKRQSLQNHGNAVGAFIQAAILLGFRSAYEYEMLGHLLASADTSLVDDEVARRVVDLFRLTYSQKLKQFANWDYQIVPSTTESLLVCDRPMFDMTLHCLEQEVLVIPLAPSVMLIATPPSDRSRKNLKFIVSDKTTSNIVSLTNQFTVKRARQFVVGLPEQLEAVKSMFETSKFQQRKATDRLVLERILSLHVGDQPPGLYT